MCIEEFRRVRGTKGQYMSHQAPLIRLEMPRGLFVIYKRTLDMMGIRDDDAVMFAFNRARKTGYLYKEEPQEDSFYPRGGGRGYSRFTSKDLAHHMAGVFDLDPGHKHHYFEVRQEPNEKGAHEFYLKSNNPNELTLPGILSKIASLWGVTPEEMYRKNGSTVAAEARFVYMFYLKHHERLSLGKIGQHTGGHGHATVLHGLKQVNDRADIDKVFYNRLVTLNLHQWLTKTNQPASSTR